MRDHSVVEELMAARALDGLERSEESALAMERSSHGEGCEECLRIESEYEEVAGRLAFALEPAEIRAGLEDELVARARSAPEEATLRAAQSGARARADLPSNRVARMPRLIVAAAAAVLVVAAGAAGYLIAPRGDVTATRLAEILKEPDARFVPLTGAANGSLAIAFRPGSRDVFLLGSGLDTPAEGKTYELWLIQGGKPVAGGCFVPHDGSLLNSVEADISGTQQMAVTVEPMCGTAPTTKPVFSVTL
jgi:anti-sigma-K factor RskA